MKRTRVVAVVPNDFYRAEWERCILGVGEIEKYEERELPKDAEDIDLIAENSFETLLDGVKEFANGIWLMVKGFVKMSKWAIICIIEGLKWMWKSGVGKKKEMKNAGK